MINIYGAKNFILPLLASTVLCKNKYIFNNFYNYDDVSVQLDILSQFNIKYSIENSSIIIDSSNCKMPEQLVFNKNCRGTYYFIGSTHHFYQKINFCIENGCNIDDRVIDYHLDLLSISNRAYLYDNNILTVKEGFLNNNVSKNISFNLKKPSVGATINAILIFVFGNRNLFLFNYAKEPYVFELIKFLKKLGAKIFFDKEKITILGSQPISNETITFDIMPDPIEAITYIIYSGLNLNLSNTDLSNYTIGPINISHLGESYDALKKIGISLKETNNTGYFYIQANKELHPFDIETNFFPGIYTDAQPFFTLLAFFINGQSHITENVYNNRFKYIDEYIKLKAKIKKISTNQVIVNGGKFKLHKSLLFNNYDLRADMSLMLLQYLLAGKSNIGTKFIDRGYKDYQYKICQIKNNLDIKQNFSLKKLSNIGIGGVCRFYVEVNSVDDLTASIEFSKYHGISYRIIGSGCNIYFSDYFDGLIIYNKIKHISVNTNKKHVSIKIGSGNLLQDLVDISTQNKVDIHELSDIPGTVGGAIYGNAGAYGKDVKCFLDSVVVYDIKSSSIKNISASDLNLEYRTSDLKKKILKYIIIYAKFIFKKSVLNIDKIKEKNSFISNIRRSKFNYSNTLGSIYKNTNSGTAGFLLDKLKIKNTYIHKIYISENHSNIWFNEGEANTEDLDLCIDYITKKIKNLYNIDLDLEIEKIQ